MQRHIMLIYQLFLLVSNYFISRILYFKKSQKIIKILSINSIAAKAEDTFDTWLVSYKKPPLIGPIVNPKPGATIAKPTAAP